MDAHQAWQIFLDGLLAAPYAREHYRKRQVGPFPVIRFATPALIGMSYFDEYFIEQGTPAEVHAALRSDQRTPEHYVTVLNTKQVAWHAEALPGYRLRANEFLMARDLTDLPTLDPAIPVQTVQSTAEASWLNDNDPTEASWIQLPNLADPALTHVYSMYDGRPVARGASTCLRDQLYISAIYTHPSYRRRGLARAIMLALLTQGATQGASGSVLTSSSAGEQLYRGLGYHILGRLLIYEPEDSVRQ